MLKNARNTCNRLFRDRLWGTTGVNILNRDRYDQDAIHPYLIDGKKALARAWISGLKNIHPIID